MPAQMYRWFSTSATALSKAVALKSERRFNLYRSLNPVLRLIRLLHPVSSHRRRCSRIMVYVHTHVFTMHCHVNTVWAMNETRGIKLSFVINFPRSILNILRRSEAEGTSVWYLYEMLKIRLSLSLSFIYLPFAAFGAAVSKSRTQNQVGAAPKKCRCARRSDNHERKKVVE